MSAWIAAVPEPPDGAWASARVRDAGGANRGWLVAWRAERRPMPDAVRCDPRALDPAGEAADAWLLLLPHRVPFDDPAVQHGRRCLLAHDGFAAVTTFSRDASTFGGALCAWRGAWAPPDPFFAAGPSRRVAIGAGLLAAGPPALPSAIVERYAGKPWPADGFRS